MNFSLEQTQIFDLQESDRGNMIACDENKVFTGDARKAKVVFKNVSPETSRKVSGVWAQTAQRTSRGLEKILCQARKKNLQKKQREATDLEN